MSNQLLTISAITNEALRILENECVFTRAVNRTYDDKFGVEGAKIGTTVNVRKPPRYIGRRTAPLAVENSTETYVPITLNNQYGTDISFSSADLKLNIDDFSTRFIRPAVANIINMIDYDGLQQYKFVNNLVGTAGGSASWTTAQAAQAAIMAARRRLNEEAAPVDADRSFVVSPGMEANLLTNLTSIFNAARSVPKMFTTGAMGDGILGFNFAMDQNAATHTNGTNTAALTIGSAQAGQTGPAASADSTFSLTITAGASAGTLTAGTTFTIAGVFGVNPQSRQSTGALKSFVVAPNPATADGSWTLNSSSTTVVSVFPPPVFSGAFQNVTSTSGQIPTGAITVTSTTGASSAIGQALAFHKDAFAFACADLPLPGGVDMASRAQGNGFSIRLVRQYDINSDQFPCRLDVLGGWRTIYPELAVRVTE